MQLVDKVLNIKIYWYYFLLRKSLIKEKIDLFVSSEEKNILPKIISEYKNIDAIEKKENLDNIDDKTLDDLVYSFMQDCFIGGKKFSLKRGIVNKTIKPELIVNYSVMEKDGVHIYLNKYSEISDAFHLIHELVHPFIFESNNPHVDSELISRLFELIFAARLDKEFGSLSSYYYNQICYQINCLEYDCFLAKLYPSNFSVIYPYIKADLLANELYLLFNQNEKEVIKDINKIFDSKLTIQEYLRCNGIIISEDNIKSISDNHRKILVP